MKFWWMALVCVAQIAFAQFAPLDEVYLPYRTGSELYLSKRPFKTSKDKIHIDALDFEHSNNFIYVAKRKERFGLLDIYGNQIEPFVYQNVRRYDQFIVLEKNGRYDVVLSSEIKFKNLEIDSFRLLNNELYYFKNGLIGLITRELQIPAKYKAIRPWRLFNKDWIYREHRDFFLAVLPNNDLQLLDNSGRSLLPGGVQHINEISHGIVRFYDGIWKYYLPTRDVIISSHGNDVIFYNQHTYKEYNVERTRSTYFRLDEKRRFQGQFEDYFYLANQDYIAVKKAGLIGVIDSKTNAVVIAPKYQQINTMRYDVDEFRCYQNDLCGVVNARNQELVPMSYHNVQKTYNPNYYATYLNKKMGLVAQGGKVTLPNIYENLNFIDERSIILQKSGKFGLANYEGEVICPAEFEDYEIQNFMGKVFFQFFNGNERLLFDHKGQFYPKTYNAAFFGNDCIKLYKDNRDIVVLFLNNAGDIEEHYSYANIVSLTLGEKHKRNRRIRQGVSFDELEENQLSGKYGKRYYAQQGMSVIPKYNTIIRQASSGIVFGELPCEAYEYEIAPTCTLQGNLAWSYIYHKSTQMFTMNEAINTGSSSTSSYQVYRLIHGVFESYAETAAQSKMLALGESLLFGAPIGFASIRKLTFGKGVHLVPVEESDISLYDYYLWANNLGLLRSDPDVLTKIMNPALGVKFESSRCMVCEPKTSKVSDKRDYFFNCQEFESFSFFPNFELKRYKKNDKDGMLWEGIKHTDAVERKKIKSYRAYRFIPNTIFFAMQREKSSEAVLHPKFPDFTFLPNHFNVDYKNGILIQKMGAKSYRLVTPDNIEILGELEEATYLINGLFFVRLNGDKFYSIFSIEKQALILTDVVEVTQKYAGMVQVRIEQKGNSSNPHEQNMRYCTSMGEVSGERPEQAPRFDEARVSYTEMSVWELYNARTLVSMNSPINWEIKAMNDFIILHSGKYFYTLSKDLQLIW